MPVIRKIELEVKIDNDGNAAFGESSSEAIGEVSRILTEALNTMEKSVSSEYQVDYNFSLRDHNGNRVGYFNLYIEFEDDDDDDEELEEDENEDEYGVQMSSLLETVLEKTTPKRAWNTARSDLKRKVREILKKQYAADQKALNDLIKENPFIVDKYISEGEDWSVPKDIACAMYGSAQDSWGPIGCSTTTKRKSKSFVNFIRGKLYWR